MQCNGPWSRRLKLNLNYLSDRLAALDSNKMVYRLILCAQYCSSTTGSGSKTPWVYSRSLPPEVHCASSHHSTNVRHRFISARMIVFVRTLVVSICQFVRCHLQALRKDMRSTRPARRRLRSGLKRCTFSSRRLPLQFRCRLLRYAFVWACLAT